MHDRSNWRPEPGRGDWQSRSRDERPYWWRDDNLPFDHDADRAARAYEEEREARRRDYEDDRRYRDERGREPREDRGHDFRGVGPRTRHDEDEDLREEICDRLAENPDLDASDILVRVIDNEAILDGSVRHKRDAERAQQLAKEVRGIVFVRNRLRAGGSRDDRVRRATIGMGYDERPSRHIYRERRRS